MTLPRPSPYSIESANAASMFRPMSLSKKIREQGGELRLANLNDDLKTLFELTKLDTLFQIADTRERALESF